MFSLPALDLLHITANAVIFAAKTTEDLPALAGARFNAAGNILDVACTDRYAMGQGRARGRSTGPDFTAVLPVFDLEPVMACLQKNAGAVVDIVPGDNAVTIRTGGEAFTIPAINAPFPDPDILFAKDTPRGSAGIDALGMAPWILERLGRLKDHHNPGCGQTSQVPLALCAGDRHATVASFGDHFRVLFTTRKSPRAGDSPASPGWTARTPVSDETWAALRTH